MQAIPLALAAAGGTAASSAIPLIIAAAGTAMQMKASADQQRQQRNILNQEMERNDQASKQASQQVLQQAQQFTEPAREQALTDAENKTYAQTQADLQGAGGASIAGAADAGNVSDDFLKTKAARAIEEGNRLTSVAREAAKARAPGQVRLDDSLSMANLSGNLQNLWGTTRNMAGASNLDAQSVQPGALYGLGKVASAVGGAMAAGGYGQTASGVPPNPYARSGINFGGR